MEGRRFGSTIRLLTLTASMAIASLTAVPEAGSAYIPHMPISINGNLDFNAFNGVTSGSGTPSDPYIIEGWDIEATGVSGISISSTDVHFVIRDVYIHAAVPNDNGIRLLSTTNGRVENVTIANTEGGIVLNACTDIAIVGNDVSDSKNSGIAVYSAQNATVVENTVSSSGLMGIYAWYTTNSTITDNDVHGNPVGILLHDSTGAAIVRNVVSDNALTGLSVETSASAVVSYNDVSNNTDGIVLTGATGIGVHHNNLIDNAVQAADDNGPENLWDDGYPSGGNYWSNYTGGDFFQGPNQDTPGSDGIGDTPFIIDADSQDNYPLMLPAVPDFPPSPPTMLPARLVGPGLADVELSWLPSADDGAGEDDVSSYRIWFGDAYDPTASTYAILDFLPAGSTTYVHAGAGAGDNSSYFYEVVAVDTGGQATPAAEQAGKHAQFLTAGMQLLSVPLEQADWDIDVVLQTVPWSRAWTFTSPAGGDQEWLSNDPGKTWADLTSLDREMAVWVELSADARWTVAGLVPASTQITLRAGWNLVGYPSFVPQPVADVLAGVSYDTVEGFAEDPPYYLQRLTPTDLMKAGSGYWIRASADAIFTLYN